MMQAEPQDEHRWLERLLGEWTITAPLPSPEGDPDGTVTWTETVRSFRGIWVVAEGQGEMPGGGGPVTTLMTLGYDPRKGAYVGTWVGSMMTHMWVYRGTLDETGNVLTLDCEGPDFENPEKTLRYQDIIAFQDDDHRTLTGRVEGADGVWKEMMVAHYQRAAAATAAA